MENEKLYLEQLDNVVENCVNKDTFLGLYGSVSIALKEIEDRLATYPHDDFDHGKNLGLLIAKDIVYNRIHNYISQLDKAVDEGGADIIGKIEWDTVCFADGWKEGYQMGAFDCERRLNHEQNGK